MHSFGNVSGFIKGGSTKPTILLSHGNYRVRNPSFVPEHFPERFDLETAHEEGGGRILNCGFALREAIPEQFSIHEMI